MPETPAPQPEDIAPLLRLGLEEEPDATLMVTAPAPRTGTSGLGAGSRGWNPPSVEELQQMLPQYEISAFIARGGMGAVYKGMQTTLKRAVAIKVLPPEIEDGDMQFKERFKHEAQAMARLSHPNIVAVHDAGETPDGLLYFVMEFIEGTDVAQLITSEGIVEPLRAIQITTAVCEALAFAHEEGIIHRDIKPSNIMIDKRGRVKVADFGLAKTVNLEATLLTGSNVAMGTPDFIAPEAMIPGMKMDQRADIYAVGVMLYQMLTGTIPRGRFEPPSGVISEMDKGFDAVVDKAMQTDRDKRYSTALEMKTAVEKVPIARSGNDPVPETVPAGLGKSRSLKAHPLIAGSVIVLGTGVFFALKKPEPNGLRSPRSDTSEFNVPATANSPKAAPAPFSLAQWEQVFPNDRHQWEKHSIYKDGLLHVKSSGGVKRPMPSADGTIRAVVHIKTGDDTPTLYGRYSFERGYYQALWDVSQSTIALYYYPIGTGKGGMVLCGRPMPKDMIMKVGDVLKLELRLEGDHLSALTNGKPLLDFRSDKIMNAGEWGIKSTNGTWFESVEIEPLPSPAQRIAESSRPPEPKPAQIEDSPKSPIPNTNVEGEKWERMWNEPSEFSERKTVAVEDGWLVSKVNSSVGSTLLYPRQWRDSGIRSEWRWTTGSKHSHFSVRQWVGNRYQLSCSESSIRLMYKSAAEEKVLKDYPIAEPKIGDTFTMELRAIGTTLIAKLDGREIIRVEDDKLEAGGPGLYLYGTAAMRNIEVLNLDTGKARTAVP